MYRDWVHDVCLVEGQKTENNKTYNVLILPKNMPQNIIMKNGKVLNFKEIPEGHKIEYIVSSVEIERFYVVHAPHITVETVDKSLDLYDLYGMFIGTPNGMQEAEVEEVCRWRDGGTTKIFYTLENKYGQLYLPSRLIKGAIASDKFDGKTVEIKRLIEGNDYVSSVEHKFKAPPVKITNSFPRLPPLFPRK